MNRSASWVSWMFVAALGSTACGGTALEESLPEEQGEVRQSKYYAYCEVDGFGYQTGRCIDFNSYLLCREVPNNTGCIPSARSPLSASSSACGTIVNDSNCDRKYRPELIEL